MKLWTIRDLADRLGGKLRLADLPPLGGEFEPVGRCCFEFMRLQKGDLYCSFHEEDSVLSVEAFHCGAVGVLTANQNVQPWAGGYVIEINNVVQAYHCMIELMPSLSASHSWCAEKANNFSSNGEIDVDANHQIHETYFRQTTDANRKSPVNDLRVWNRPTDL